MLLSSEFSYSLALKNYYHTSFCLDLLGLTEFVKSLETLPSRMTIFRYCLDYSYGKQTE